MKISACRSRLAELVFAAIYFTMVVSNQKALATLVTAHIEILFPYSILFRHFIVLFSLVYLTKCI